MKHNLLVLGAVAVFGLAAAVAGVGDAGRALACDDAAKAKTASTTASCCAKDGKTAASDAKQVHGAVIKSAVVAPGASPVLNIAAFGGMLASGGHEGGCGWCPAGVHQAMAAAAGCPAYASKGTAPDCEAHRASATTASVKDDGAAVVASTGGSCCSVKTAAAAMTASTCRKSAATTAMASSSAGCDSDAAAAKAAGSGCSAKTAGASCDKELESAALKGAVDEVPYRENKRLVLTGAYACGSCTLKATEACAPMFKTSDGKVYPLVKNSKASDLRKAGAATGIEVSTVVRKIDGVKYLEVKSYKTL